jgi:hypothetical protein
LADHIMCRIETASTKLKQYIQIHKFPPSTHPSACVLMLPPPSTLCHKFPPPMTITWATHMVEEGECSFQCCKHCKEVTFWDLLKPYENLKMDFIRYLQEHRLLRSQTQNLCHMVTGVMVSNGPVKAKQGKVVPTQSVL